MQTRKKTMNLSTFWKNLKRDYILYLMLSVGLVFYLCFKIKPFMGLLIAFKDFNPMGGSMIAGEWVGMKHFNQLFQSDNFILLLKNTLTLSVYSIVFYFPLPIILALLLNEVEHELYKKVVQTITYIPHFFSWVVIAGISYGLLTVDGGGVNNLLDSLFGVRISFLTDENMLKPLLIGQQIWKDIGWGSIIYLAAMTNIDPGLYEAAAMDGATRFQKIMHITLPCIAPTIATLLILRMGTFMDSGFDQIFLMLNTSNRVGGEVFDTYIYEIGIRLGQLSYATSVGVFKSVISLIMVLTTNHIAKRLGNDGIM